MNDIIDDVTLGLCFEVHRSSKLGTLFLGDTDPLYVYIFSFYCCFSFFSQTFI